jgi:16S rRNA (cytosine1402-N4)-methyltransferase
MDFSHTPVLYQEVLEQLKCQPGKTIVDCTVGGGGHAAGILSKLENRGRLIGIDQDSEALLAAEKTLREIADNYYLYKSNFRFLSNVLYNHGITKVDGILLDIGVSSYQLDNPERGFTYQEDAPLDMRMDVDKKLTAADLVNQLSAEELTRIFLEYGEERWGKRIAEFIVSSRKRERIATTGQLVRIVKAAIPKGAREGGPHPAKRTFQALRIAVNGELDALQEALETFPGILNKGGRLCVITFHSLEDRIVKNFMKREEKGCICPPKLPVCQCGHETTLKVITKKPIIPSQEEMQINPRSRSAKLRVAERV